MEYEHSQLMAIEFDRTQSLLRQPHVYMRPRIYPDGDKWCALYGENIQEGVAGFGETPELACYDFDKNWYHQLCNRNQ